MTLPAAPMGLMELFTTLQQQQQPSLGALVEPQTPLPKTDSAMPHPPMMRPLGRTGQPLVAPGQEDQWKRDWYLGGPPSDGLPTLNDILKLLELQEQQEKMLEFPKPAPGPMS